MGARLSIEPAERPRCLQSTGVALFFLESRVREVR